MTLRGHTGPIMSMTGGPSESDHLQAQWWSGMIFSGGIDGSLVIWQIPENSRIDLNEPYLDSESPSMGS